MDEILGEIKDATGLVNNAALGLSSPCLEATEAEFDRLFNINVKATLHVSQIFAKSLIARNRPGKRDRFSPLEI